GVQRHAAVLETRERARGCSGGDARLPSRSGTPRLARSGTTLLRTGSVLLSGARSCMRVVPPLASPRSTLRAGALRVRQNFRVGSLVLARAVTNTVTRGVASGGFGRLGDGLGALGAGGDRQGDHLAPACRPARDLELGNLGARPLPLETTVVAIERRAPLLRVGHAGLDEVRIRPVLENERDERGPHVVVPAVP